GSIHRLISTFKVSLGRETNSSIRDWSIIIGMLPPRAWPPACEDSAPSPNRRTGRSDTADPGASRRCPQHRAHTRAGRWFHRRRRGLGKPDAGARFAQPRGRHRAARLARVGAQVRAVELEQVEAVPSSLLSFAWRASAQSTTNHNATSELVHHSNVGCVTAAHRYLITSAD